MPTDTGGTGTVTIPQPLKISTDSSDLLAQIAMRIYANSNFDNDKYSEHEASKFAKLAVKRAKVLIDALG